MYDGSEPPDCITLAPQNGKRQTANAPIRPREHDAAGRRLAGEDALALLLRAVERDAADRRFGFLLNLVLGGARAIPVREQETGVFNLRLELVVTVHRPRVLVAKVSRRL